MVPVDKVKEWLEMVERVVVLEERMEFYMGVLKQCCYHLFIHSHFAESLKTLGFEAKGVKKITVIF